MNFYMKLALFIGAIYMTSTISTAVNNSVETIVEQKSKEEKIIQELLDK